MKELTSEQIEKFQQKIFFWWKENRRDLPWRKTDNPYFIMISEVMLQQTQVSRSINKYLEFIENFPTLESLANASKAEILKIWSGLGYNRRALWLQEAASQILEMGTFPSSPEELMKLKGIGPYTSHSILIFTFNKDLIAVDTNIRRILITEGFAEESTSEKELYKIAERLLPRGKSRDWHNALMDFGAIKLTSAKTGIKPLTSQTKYKDSTRFYRGKIIKLLTEKKEISIQELNELLEVEEKKVLEIIDKLLKDGLIKEREGKYSLP